MASPAAAHSSPDSSQLSDHSQTTQTSIYRSPQMRKEALRSKYLNAQALQSNVNIRTLENLEEIVAEVDTINGEGSLEEKLQDQGEVLLDSEIMSVSSNVIKKCTFSLSTNINSYDPMEFADNIKSYLCRLPDSVSVGSDLPDWSLLGKTVMKLFRITPKLTMFLGTLRPIPKKEKTKPRKVVREAQAPTKRPEKVIVLDKVEDSVEQIVHAILMIIKNYQKQHNKPLDFFSLVLHPTDFGKTVENILHVSFLIRDGLIKCTIDEDGIPYLQKSNKDEVEEANKKNTRNVQNVLSMTMRQWKALVNAYGMVKPMIDIKLNYNKSK
ncbi:non-structural maintenance of chromosomes element 4 homolog A-like [Copidosoma floridanum]|uniref:non-structural maintenance of chromosomes element 4 homolog A-like n=1 Tax=Copidosoma floridanum TaxID=29053 RepID=UPI0006C9BF4F|nr:non-structural maintenance of chromosomes element 4 homolog A-like [Copidosoma floridanum]